LQACGKRAAAAHNRKREEIDLFTRRKRRETKKTKKVCGERVLEFEKDFREGTGKTAIKRNWSFELWRKDCSAAVVFLFLFCAFAVAGELEANCHKKLGAEQFAGQWREEWRRRRRRRRSDGLLSGTREKPPVCTWAD
jgi:hypothetical protein